MSYLSPFEFIFVSVTVSPFYKELIFLLLVALSGTLLIEPKPQEPTKHQYVSSLSGSFITLIAPSFMLLYGCFVRYDWDAATTANFLRKYGLIGNLKFYS